jgi:hypothetical protein
LPRLNVLIIIAGSWPDIAARDRAAVMGMAPLRR